MLFFNFQDIILNRYSGLRKIDNFAFSAKKVNKLKEVKKWF